MVVRRGWLMGYVAAIFLAAPVALPCWNAFLRDSVGRFVTIQQIHFVEYVGLGAVVVLAGGAAFPSWQRWFHRMGLVGGVGFLEELFQGFLPQRHFEFSDVLMNWAGGWMGLVLLGGWTRFSRSR